MKFFEFEEGKAYRQDENGIFIYRLEKGNIEFRDASDFEWRKSLLSPIELYRMDFEEIDLNKKDFDNLGYRVRVGNIHEMIVTREYNNYERFKDQDAYKGDIYYEVGNSYGVMSFEEFDEIADYVNKLRNLAERVRK